MPFANLAPVHIDEINKHIEKLRPHKGFIVTDHYYDRILEISDRIVLIHNGCNYQIDSREDLYMAKSRRRRLGSGRRRPL